MCNVRLCNARFDVRYLILFAYTYHQTPYSQPYVDYYTINLLVRTAIRYHCCIMRWYFTRFTHALPAAFCAWTRFSFARLRTCLRATTTRAVLLLHAHMPDVARRTALHTRTCRRCLPYRAVRCFATLPHALCVYLAGGRDGRFTARSTARTRLVCVCRFPNCLAFALCVRLMPRLPQRTYIIPTATYSVYHTITLTVVSFISCSDVPLPLCCVLLRYAITRVWLDLCTVYPTLYRCPSRHAFHYLPAFPPYSSSSPSHSTLPNLPCWFGGSVLLPVPSCMPHYYHHPSTTFLPPPFTFTPTLAHAIVIDSCAITLCVPPPQPPAHQPIITCPFTITCPLPSALWVLITPTCPTLPCDSQRTPCCACVILCATHLM